LKKLKARFIGILLCITLALGMMPAQASSPDAGFVTREQAVAGILNTVGFGTLSEAESDLSAFKDASLIDDEYTDEIAKAVTNGILLGTGDKLLNPRKNITRLEFATLVSRTLRELPIIEDDQTFTDIPAASAGDISRLVKAGLIEGYGNGIFGAVDYLTREQLDAVMARITILPKTRLQDDFYYAANQKWLTSTRLPAGYPGLSSFDEVSLSNDNKLKLIARDLLNKSGSYTKGTKEQKVADFYSTVLDMENRNKQGIEPIKEYLDRIDSAESVQKLLSIQSQLENEIGFNSLFSFSPTTDLKDSSRYCLYGTGLRTVLPASYMINENPQIKSLYEGFIAKLLMLSGEAEEIAAKDAQNIYAFESIIARSTMSNELASKVENIYNPFTVNDLAKLFPNIDIKSYLNELGYGSVESLVVTDVELMKKTGELLTDGNLDLLKDYSRYILIMSSSQFLSKDFSDTIAAFNSGFLGISSTVSDEDTAFNILNSVMSSYIGQMYTEKYFSEDAKKDVENIVDEIIDTYKKRIKKLDWMSDKTKNAAILKLDNISVKIGYPDVWKDPLKGISIKTYAEGGSLPDNIFAISSAQVKYSKILLSKPVDKSDWTIPPHTVNAYYNATNNEITFPAGILQAPFYDVKATREQNLGGIGSVIAHEITHAFDNNGAQFNEKGNMVNWWTEADYANFQKKCQAVIKLYNGLEIAPNAFVNGNLTVSEKHAALRLLPGQRARALRRKRRKGCLERASIPFRRRAVKRVPGGDHAAGRRADAAPWVPVAGESLRAGQRTQKERRLHHFAGRRGGSAAQGEADPEELGEAHEGKGKNRPDRGAGGAARLHAPGPPDGRAREEIPHRDPGLPDERPGLGDHRGHAGRDGHARGQEQVGRRPRIVQHLLRAGKRGKPRAGQRDLAQGTEKGKAGPSDLRRGLHDAGGGRRRPAQSELPVY
jgi:putative endopeptidase